MAYSALPTKSAGDTITLANWTAIKDNFEAGVPDIFTTAGDMPYATGANAATRLALGTADAVLVAGASAPAWQNVPCCSIWRSTNFDPTEDAWDSVEFDTEIADVNSMADLGADSTLITIPANGDGFYLIGGNVKFDMSATGGLSAILSIRILHEGATVIAEHGTAFSNAFAAADVPLTICVLYPMNAAETLELQVYTSEDIDIVSTGNYSPVFWAAWQRRL